MALLLLLACIAMSDSDNKMTLDELRAAIDAVDDEVLSLIHKRAALAAAVGEQKVNQATPRFMCRAVKRKSSVDCWLVIVTRQNTRT